MEQLSQDLYDPQVGAMDEDVQGAPHDLKVGSLHPEH